MYADWNYIRGFPKKIVVVTIARASRAKFFLKKTFEKYIRRRDSDDNF